MEIDNELDTKHRNMIATITGVPPEKLVGPFKDNPPVRDGVYARISSKTGEVVFANFVYGQWKKYSSTIEGALGKVSSTRYLGLPWYGVVEEVRNA